MCCVALSACGRGSRYMPSAQCWAIIQGIGRSGPDKGYGTEYGTTTPLNIQLTKLANLIGKIGFSVAGLAFAIFFIKDVILVYPFSTFHTFADWLPALKLPCKYFMMAETLIVGLQCPKGCR